ncbi:hypothetical protein [Spirosoma aerolatum]|uniref:hypothetical protein n=1 Tax=Spirosoma aerolatum TaxID=1211326 RepID=UPI0009ABDB37|nr:hypothetical protein [Spirosoma aerolatum]
MKKLDYSKMQFIQGGQSLDDLAAKKLKAPGAYLVCLGGTLIACFAGGPLGLVELVACGYTVYANW